MSRRTFIKRAALASLGVSIASCHSRPARYLEAPPDRHAAGPLLMIDLPGPELDAATAAFIRRHDIRAVCLFRRNMRSRFQAQELTAQLREVMGPYALIAVDQEGGGVVRTRDLPYPPSAMSLGASGDARLAFEVGAATGRALASLGINWNFAPVLDVNSNPLNPVIADRSFGGNPFLVSELGLAWARGCQQAGVATCVKHFPGHGDTAVDSHYGLPTVDKDLALLQALDLQPFRAAARAGIPAFMTSHIVYTALDETYPATLSPSILTDLLRRAWRYDGVIITDSMSMRAITDVYGQADGAVQALRAGADMVMAFGSLAEQERTLQTVEAAIKAGDLPAGGRADRLYRLDQLAWSFPARTPTYPPAQRYADARLMQQAWTRGLTSYLDPGRPTPGSRLILVVAEDVAVGGASDSGLRAPTLRTLLAKHYDLDVVYYDRRRPFDSLLPFHNLDRHGAAVVFASTSRHRPDERLQAFIRAIEPGLHLALWNPYTVLDVDAPALITYGFRPEALHGVRDWMLGHVDAGGEVPISLTA